MTQVRQSAFRLFDTVAVVALLGLGLLSAGATAGLIA